MGQKWHIICLLLWPQTHNNPTLTMKKKKILEKVKWEKFYKTPDQYSSKLSTSLKSKYAKLTPKRSLRRCDK